MGGCAQNTHTNTHTSDGTPLLFWSDRQACHNLQFNHCGQCIQVAATVLRGSTKAVHVMTSPRNSKHMSTYHDNDCCCCLISTPSAHLTCSCTGGLGRGGSGSAWQYRSGAPLLSQVSRSVNFTCADTVTQFHRHKQPSVRWMRMQAVYSLQSGAKIWCQTCCTCLMVAAGA